MYEYTDKVIEALDKYIIRQFDKLNFTNETTYITSAKRLYKKIDKKARECFLDIAAYYYFENTDSDKYKPTKDSIDKWLKEYNPVTTYQYDNEVERKAARYAESMLATNGAAKEKKIGMRYLSNMTTEYCLEATDNALINAYKANGVDKVIWVTENDDRVCHICIDRDGKKYDIDKIPPKPHLNCRCYYIPAK